MTKKEVRAEVRRRMAAMTPQQRADESAVLCRRILDLPQWQIASCVLLYDSLPDEVDTSILKEAASLSGKRVLIPAASADAPLFSDEDLASVDLAVIPGRAFTQDGKRLGRGGGYYDRILPKMSCLTAGLCFKCQIFDELPVDEWDVKINELI